MTTTERRLRTAFEDAARTIEPGSLAPLTIPSRRRRGTWTVPVAVAAALAMVLVGATLIGDRMRGGPPPAQALAAGGPQHILAVRAGRAVVEDVTGHRLFEVPRAEGRYRAVAGTAREFFLAVQTTEDTYSFYRVTLGADGAPSRPRKLPGPLFRTQTGFGKPENLAASPDGSKLAVVGTVDGHAQVDVIDVRTGAHRIWRTPEGGAITSATWSQDNRTLGFLWGPKAADLRLLDTRGDGAELEDARVLRGSSIRSRAPGFGLINVFVFNPDGRTLTAQVQGTKTGDHDDTGYVLLPLSASTGEPAGRPVRLPSDSFFVKTDTTGRHLLQIIDGRPGRVEDGRFSWISRAADYDDAAW
ncbi:hypothetical protein [Actinomadura roseirufa]|uniref:hypothetical protein n=1 Tax=Actinomadura roseirufa TaxID=2094049 RepID=UPI001040E4B0|nr:hypothetical protein [Actinomadura roseirufa]